MAIPVQTYALIHDRIEELRREIAEIAAAVKEWHLSGSQKVKHEKRIKRQTEIQSELSSLIWKDGWGVKF